MVNTAIAQAAEIIAPKTSYIVAVDGDYNDVVRDQLISAGISIGDEFEYAFDGFILDLADYQLPFVQSLEYVDSIEVDSVVRMSTTQASTPSWGIDRIDQRERVDLATPGNYEYFSAGTGSTIYIGDTGVLAHEDLAGRISPSGYSGFNDRWGSTDCNGHGTHVATTAAGTKYGIAKNATIVPVRILNCAGSGQISGVIAALDWILSPLNPNPKTQAVLNLSIGGGKSTALNDAVERVVNAGITVVVAAGNDRVDACTKSPASATNAITVGATTVIDSRATYSNFGSCVDINAPGSEITAGWVTSNTSTRTIQGTSMASPHVAGAVAVYLGLHPTATVAQVTSAIDLTATQNAITGLVTLTPNKLLYVSPTDTWPIYAAPKVEFKSVEAISSTSALVNMAVNPESLSTTSRVEFSTDSTFTTALRTATPAEPTVSGADVVSTNVALTSLSAATKYFFRLVGENSAGTLISPTYTLTTKTATSAAPTVAVNGATLITAYSAQLNGTVNPNGLATEIQVTYSPDPAFLTNVKTISGRTYSTGGTSAVSLNVTPINLLGDTTYYYKIGATNSFGYSLTSSMSFKTLIAPGIAPAVSVTAPTIGLNPESQTFSGFVNPQSQPTTVVFNYARDSGFTFGIGSVTLPVVNSDTVTPISVVVNGLIPGQTYYVRFDASNESGLTFGNTVYGRVNSVMPQIFSAAHSLVTNSTVKFTSSINAGASNSRNSFVYSTTPTFDTFTAIDGTPFAVTSAVTTTISASVAGLTPGTTYYYRARLMAYTGPFAYSGFMYGQTQSFTTTGVAPTPTPTPTPDPTPEPTPIPIPGPTPDPTPEPTPTPTPTPDPTPIPEVIPPSPAPIVITPPPAPAPSIIFVPVPRSPIEIVKPEKPEDVKPEKPQVETVTAKVFVAPIKISETPTVPSELTTQLKEIKKIEALASPVTGKILTKIAVPKLPAFKGAGPFTFAIGLAEQGNTSLITDSSLAVGVKVSSQTPKTCSVSVKFNKQTSTYTVNVAGISNGECKITAIDKGTSEKFPTVTEIRKTISGISAKKTVSAKAIKPPPTQKAVVTKAGYKPKRS